MVVKNEVKSRSVAGLKAGKRRRKRRLNDLPAKTLSSEQATNVRGGDYVQKKHIGNVKYFD